MLKRFSQFTSRTYLGSFLLDKWKECLVTRKIRMCGPKEIEKDTTVHSKQVLGSFFNVAPEEEVRVNIWPYSVCCCCKITRKKCKLLYCKSLLHFRCVVHSQLLCFCDQSPKRNNNKHCLHLLDGRPFLRASYTEARLDWVDTKVKMFCLVDSS